MVSSAKFDLWDRPDHARIRAERMRLARKKGTHTRQEWQAILDEVGDICVRCRKRCGYFEKDHIVPIYQGGSDAATNLQPLCYRCNSSKGPDDTNFLEQWRNEGRPRG